MKTNLKAMQRFENASRNAELLGYVLGESARPNRKNKKSRTKTKNEKHTKKPRSLIEWRLHRHLSVRQVFFFRRGPIVLHYFRNVMCCQRLVLFILKTKKSRENKLQRSWGCEGPSQESQHIVFFNSFLEFFCFLHGALPKEFQNVVSFCFAFQNIVFEFW